MSALRVGVNLLWLVPGEVGGSEEYICRLLEGVDEVTSPGVEITLFVNRRFWGAHPSARGRASSRGRRDIGPLEGGKDHGRVDVAQCSARQPRCRPRPSSWRNRAGADTRTGAAVLARSPVPRPPRVLLVAEAALPRRCRAEIDASGGRGDCTERVRTRHGDRAARGRPRPRARGATRHPAGRTRLGDTPRRCAPATASTDRSSSTRRSPTPTRTTSLRFGRSPRWVEAHPDLVLVLTGAAGRCGGDGRRRDRAPRPRRPRAAHRPHTRRDLDGLYDEAATDGHPLAATRGSASRCSRRWPRVSGRRCRRHGAARGGRRRRRCWSIPTTSTAGPQRWLRPARPTSADAGAGRRRARSRATDFSAERAATRAADGLPSRDAGEPRVNLLVLCPHFAPDVAPTGEVMTQHRRASWSRAATGSTSSPRCPGTSTTHRARVGAAGRCARETTPWGTITRVHPFPTDKRNIPRRAVAFGGFTAPGRRVAACRRRPGRRRAGHVAAAHARARPAGPWPRRRRAPFVFNIQDVFPDVAVELGRASPTERVIAAASWLERVTYRACRRRHRAVRRPARQRRRQARRPAGRRRCG